jgi:hypothetical protein
LTVVEVVERILNCKSDLGGLAVSGLDSSDHAVLSVFVVEVGGGDEDEFTSLPVDGSVDSDGVGGSVGSLGEASPSGLTLDTVHVEGTVTKSDNLGAVNGDFGSETIAEQGDGSLLQEGSFRSTDGEATIVDHDECALEVDIAVPVEQEVSHNNDEVELRRIVVNHDSDAFTDNDGVATNRGRRVAPSCEARPQIDVLVRLGVDGIAVGRSGDLDNNWVEHCGVSASGAVQLSRSGSRLLLGSLGASNTVDLDSEGVAEHCTDDGQDSATSSGATSGGDGADSRGNGTVVEVADT